ncbi:MAG: hypothetical protein H5U08_01895 [Thermogutta sp.]|uniref:YdjY domain-containing protein n=1 Tax=Thermogutta sp. TaxID=1962930 RepID=UPI0019A29E54|nr:YdjY domain-containing protein [Thermogutta sp.]MBC7351085.1 hypothetical protein [Thermogutta sp.]
MAMRSQTLLGFLAILLSVIPFETGCRREQSGTTVSQADAQFQEKAAVRRDEGKQTQPPGPAVANPPEANAGESTPSAANLMDILDIELKAATEWQAGNEVTFHVEVTNHGEVPVDHIEIQGSVQFGLQDTISEARWTFPVGRLSAGQTVSPVLSYVCTKPGIWYVAAAIYQKGELIKATTRTLYIRETESPKPKEKLEKETVSLGPPLVEHPERLQRLHPEYPIWLDAEGRAVVMIGQVCQRQAPLELFACLKNSKEHESVVSIDTRAYIVHAGLLALGVEPGRPVQFYPEYRPAEGPEIDVIVAWKDPEGKVHTTPAQQWVRDVRTKQPMSYPWIFTGSQLLTDEETGKQYYYADTTGELICVSNFPSAVLDLPIRSTDSNDALLFEAFTENIPPLGTPVTVILKPKGTNTSPKSSDEGAMSTPPTPAESAGEKESAHPSADTSGAAEQKPSDDRSKNSPMQ